MAKRPSKSTMDLIRERRMANEEAASLLGTKGRRSGRANITLAEERAIRKSDGSLKGLSKAEKRRLYEKTLASQKQRQAAAKRKR